MRKDWVEHLEKSQSITPSKTILSFQEKLVESDLSPSTKANLIQQSSKMGNTLKYWKQKVFFSFFLFFFFFFFFFFFLFFFFFFLWINLYGLIEYSSSNCFKNHKFLMLRKWFYALIQEVSFKFGFEDHPSVFIELGSKILIANYVKPDMKEFFINGVFKLSPSLQLMILGVPLRGLLFFIWKEKFNSFSFFW